MRTYTCPTSRGHIEFPDAAFKLSDALVPWSKAKAGDPIGVELDFTPASQQPYALYIMVATGEGVGSCTIQRLDKLTPEVAARVSPCLVGLLLDGHPLHREIMSAAGTVPGTDEDDFCCFLTAGAGLVTLERDDVFQYAIDVYEGDDVDLGEYLHLIVAHADSAHQTLSHIKQVKELLGWMAIRNANSMVDETPFTLAIDEENISAPPPI
jgi:hypothetical protein